MPYWVCKALKCCRLGMASIYNCWATRNQTLVAVKNMNFSRIKRSNICLNLIKSSILTLFYFNIDRLLQNWYEIHFLISKRLECIVSIILIHDLFASNLEIQHSLIVSPNLQFSQIYSSVFLKRWFVRIRFGYYPKRA